MSDSSATNQSSKSANVTAGEAYLPNLHKDGGPAHPCVITWLDDDGRYQGAQTGIHQGWHEGMTLRDWFAGQALAALAASDTYPSELPNVAAWCYRHADEMLKARTPAVNSQDSTGA